MKVLIFLVGCLGWVTQTIAYDRDSWINFSNMNYVTDLTEGGNVIYIATTGGIRRYDQVTKKWLPPLTTLDGLPNNHVQRMAYDHSTGDLWFETTMGSGRYLSGLQTVMPGGNPPARLYQLQARPELPPVFPPFGYYVNAYRVMGPRQNYAVTDLFIDTWRTLWIATWGLGVGQANLNDQQLHFDTYGPLEENITAIAKDGDTIWMGGEDTFQTPARGITRYHLSTLTWEYFDADHVIGMDDPKIATILPDKENVWFGTYSGLMRYERQTNRWLTYRDTYVWGRINGMARDGNLLWIGSDRGLALLDVPADSLDRVSGSERAVIQTLVAGPDFIWAGTEVGLYQCRRGDRTWRPVADPHGFSKRSIRALTIYNHDLWIATEIPGALIRHTSSDSSWQEFPLSELSNRRHVSITADSTHIWVGTDVGAFFLDIPRQLWTQYSTFNGLIDPRVQAMLQDGKVIYFGTTKGISQFHWAREMFNKN